MGQNLLELVQILAKVVQNFLASGRAGGLHVLPDQVFQQGNIVLVLHRLETYHVLVDPLVEVPVLVQNVGNAAAHARGEVFAGLAQHHHSAAGHVLTAVVAHALHNRRGAGVADAESFACHAADEGLAAGGAIEGHVADDNVLAAVVGDVLGRIHDDLAAGQALAQIVVAVAYQFQGQSLGDEGAEALTAVAVADDMEGVVGQGVAEFRGNLGAENAAEGTVGVAHLHGDGSGLGLLTVEALFELLHENLHIGSLLKTKVINRLRLEVDVGVFHQGIVQQCRQIHLAGTGAGGGGLDLQQVGAAHQLFHGAHAQLCHVFPQILSHELHEVHDMLRLALELLAQFGVLGADAHGAGVQIAHPHHHAAHGNQRAGAEAEFFRAQHGGDGNIPAGHELTVGLNAHPGAQAVHDQALMSFRDAQLPGQARVMDGGVDGGRAGTAVKAGNQDDLRTGLGNAGGDGADTGFTDQLDIDSGLAVGALQVVNQLGQILNGVDIVVRRGRDQANTRGRVAALGNPGIDLRAGQLTALAGLRALSHFDLDFLGGHQVFAGDAEPGGCHLLDGAVALGAEAILGFAALAGVGLAAQAVHSDGHALVGLLRQSAVAHGCGLEAFDDTVNALHLFDGHALGGVIEVQQASQVHIVAGFVGGKGSILLEFAVVIRPDRLLQQVDGLGIVQVLFRRGAAAELVSTGAGQIHIDVQSQGVEGLTVPVFQLLLDVQQRDAAHPADGVGEILVDDVGADAHGLENLAALIGLDGGDAHFGGDLHDARQHGLVVVAHGGVVVLFQQAVMNQAADALLGKIRIDGAGAIAQESREIVHQSRLAAFQNQGHGGALTGTHQILGHRAHRQQAGDGNVVFIDVPVGQDQDIGSVPVGPVNVHEQPVNGLFQRGILIVADGNGDHLEPRHLHGLDLHQVGFRQNGVVDFQHLAVVGGLFQQVTLGAHIDGGGGDNFFPQRVNWGVRDLCEHLLEVFEQRGMGVTQHGQWGVAAHGSRRLTSVLRHLQHDGADVLVAVAEGLLQPHQLLMGVLRYPLVGHLQIVHAHQVPVQPLAVGLAAGIVGLQRFVVHQFALYGVHQQHLAGAQAVLAFNILGGNIQHAHLTGQDQPSVLGDVVAAGAQAVAVENRAHDVAVAEQNGGGAIPGLQHGGVILVEIPLLGIRALVVAPRLGDGDHHRQRQLHAVHQQELQSVIQHSGVRAALIDNGQHLGHVIFQVLAADGLLTGQHGIHVTPDGVDFAVVEDVAVGVGTVPAGGGVGGEPAVHHANGGLVVLVLQIRIEQPQLLHQEHTLIDNGAAGQAANIGLLIGLLKDPAGNVELAVKVDAGLHPLRLANKTLPDAGHTVSGLVAQHIGAGGHFPPAQEGQAFLLADDLEQLLRLIPGQFLLREEEHTDAVLPLAAKRDSGQCRRFGEEFVSDLKQNAHTIAGLALGVLTGPVFQVLHNLQGVVKSLVALSALDVHHRADAAVVVLEPWVIQSGGRRAFGEIIHIFFSSRISLPRARAAVRAAGMKKI